MSARPLHGIVPPLPTPLNADESIDESALSPAWSTSSSRPGVHGLWILGTTARFDLVTDADARARRRDRRRDRPPAGCPMVLNVSDRGTRRTLERARLFDDLPYDYYAALPPWYQPMTSAEVADYFRALADTLSRPLVIYNAPWVCNQLAFDAPPPAGRAPADRRLQGRDAEPVPHARLADRRAPAQGFSYLHGNDLLAHLDRPGGRRVRLAPGRTPLPELAVAIWDAARADDAERAFRLQAQFTRLGRATGFGPMLACLEVVCRHRGLARADAAVAAPVARAEAGPAAWSR